MTEPFVSDPDFTLYNGDALEVLRSLPPSSVDCCVTSPPYLDARPEYDSPTPREWSPIFYHLARVTNGPVFLNVGRIWRDGRERLWWLELLRAVEGAGLHVLDTLVWVKPNANPIRGLVFADSHEYVFVIGKVGTLFNTDGVRRPHAESTKARFGRAWTNHRGVKNPRESRARKTRAEPNPLGARPRSYVEFCVGREKGNPHPAPMPQELAEHLIRLGSWEGMTVLDPFGGSGTTARAARNLGRSAVLIEKSPDYCQLAAARLGQQSLLAEGAA